MHARVQPKASWREKPPVSFQGLLLTLMAGAAGITAVKSYKDQKLQQVGSVSSR